MIDSVEKEENGPNQIEAFDLVVGQIVGAAARGMIG